jgi:tubulin polyglutamylase TTLL6/13
MVEKGTVIELRRLKCRIIHEALTDYGYVVATEDDPNSKIIWWDGFIPPEEFALLKPHQRINKIPQMDLLCYKSTLFQSLNQIQSLFPQYYTFFPETFLLPHQFLEFHKEHVRILSGKAGANLTWIFKPRCGSCGNGIRLIQNPLSLINETAQGVIQRYLPPFLIDGYKFDFRVYLLISTLSPFTVYIYKEGLARFCTSKYSPPIKKNLDNKFGHITNTAVNIGNSSATNDFTRTLSDTLRLIADDPIGENVWEKIKNVSILTLLSIYPQILAAIPKPKSTPRGESPHVKKGSGASPAAINKYFHICGIDILLDEDANPFVLELNDRPSMKVQFPCEEQLKHDLICDAMKIVTVDGTPLKEQPDGKNGWEQIIPAPESNPMASVYRSIQQRATNVFGPKNSILSHSNQKTIIYPKPVPDKNKVFRNHRHIYQ